MVQKKEKPKGVKCLSFQQPYASMIAAGIKTVECRSRKTAKVFPKIDGLVYGYAIGLVDVVDCVPFEEKHLKPAMMSQMPDKDSYAWILENPRMIVPHPVKASAGFFYTDFTPDVIDTDIETYEQIVLPLAHTSDDTDAFGAILYCLFEYPEGFWQMFEL